jgi:RNA-directed DNA polymerase
MNIEEVQRRLWEQSKTHRENREASLPLFLTNTYANRIRNLFDLIHQPNWLDEAASRVYVRSKGKAPGVDGITVSAFKEHGTEHLQALRLELKKRTYRPQPLRRVEIPKTNGKMRQLGIPCLRDKIVQESMRMALEPIFEVEFHENSYGFRPHRNAHHAVFFCRLSMQHGFTWVIEGDVKACFDEISHNAILGTVREKVMDNKFLDLLQLLLKAGVITDGKLLPTVKGVPQGGVVSPLLANIVLNKLDWFLHGKAKYGMDRSRVHKLGEPNLRFVRYADDWCVFLTRANKRYAEALKEEIREFLLDQCSLELSVEKTKVTHVRDGFEFLGFQLERGIGQKGKFVPKIKIRQKAIADIRLRLNEVTRYRPSQESIDARVRNTSVVIRGWSNYFKIAHNFSAVAGKLDDITHWAMVKAISRKNDKSTKQVHRKFYFNGRIGVSPNRTLARFSDTKMRYGIIAPVEYEPGKGIYLEDYEWEANFLYPDKTRPGQMDLKLATLERDGYQCRRCGSLVVSESSHVDHIKPVHQFASFEQANIPITAENSGRFYKNAVFFSIFVQNCQEFPTAFGIYLTMCRPYV